MKSYRALIKPQALLTYLISFLIGSLYAQTLPTLSVYVVERFNTSPFYLGVFFIALAASAVAVSQVVGVLSDKGINRLLLILGGMSAGALACVGFAVSNHYGWALACGVFIFSFTAITLPQIMAQGREYADQNLPATQVALFNAILRASFALSWIAGPPIGFYLQHRLGATQHYLYLGVAYFGVGITAWLLLPNVAPSSKSSASSKVSTSANEQTSPVTSPALKESGAPKIPFNLKLGFIACAILFGTNHSYMIALPQLLQFHLNIPVVNTGYILGVAAAIEIPIMILGGWLGSRIALLPLMRVGAGAAACLYLGIWFANGLWQLIALQVFNAIFIGFIAGLGMTWFQDQMPNHAGTASSLFSNTVNLGNILGSVLIGGVAAWVGYRHLYLANTIAALVAVILLFVCRNHSTTHSTSLT